MIVYRDVDDWVQALKESIENVKVATEWRSRKCRPAFVAFVTT